MNKFLISVLAIFGIVFSTGFVMAYMNGGNFQENSQTYYDEERHEMMQEAFDNLDYNSWKSLMEGKKGRVLELINEDNFDKFVELREAKLNGDTQKIEELSSELGLGNGNGKGFGNHNGNKGHSRGGQEHNCMYD